MSATNIQWILCILLIITAISEEPSCIYGNPRNQYISDIARIIICGLTGPFLIFLVPVFAWKWFRKTNRYNSVVILIVGLILIIQLSVISFETIELQSSHLNLDAGIYSGVIGTKTFGGLFLGSLANSINPFFLCAMYFALLGIIVSSSSHKRKLMILFLYIQLFFLLAAIYRFKAKPEVLIPPENGARYFYVPYAMVAWSLIVVLEEIENRKRILAIIGLLCIASSALTSNFASHFIDYNWLFYSKGIGNKDIVIPINPPGWQINIKAGKQ